MMDEGKRGFKVRHKRKVASIEPTKPRNYVAKNAINSGAGAHKDKKKAMKQGDTKHKKSYAEGMEEKFQAQLDQLNEIKKGQKDSNGYSSCWTGYHAAGTKKGKNGGRVRNCVPNEDVNEDDVDDFLKAGGKIQYGKTQKGPRKPGLSLASRHIGGGGDKMKASRTGRGANTQGKPVVASEGVAEESDKQFAQRMKKQAEQPPTKGMSQKDKVEKGWAHPDTLKKKGVAEGLKGAAVGGAAGALITKTPSGALNGAEIGNLVGDMFENTDTEGAMARQQLITAAKLAIKLAEQMDSDTQLDAWVQTKISIASDYIETVFDFLVHGEQDVDKEVETDEEIAPGITHQHRHGTMKSTSTAMEGVINEKSVSQKQARTMAAAAHDPKFAKKVGIKQSVAKEYNKADKGTKQLSNAMKGKKKKKVKEDAYQIYLDVMLEKSINK